MHVLPHKMIITFCFAFAIFCCLEIIFIFPFLVKSFCLYKRKPLQLPGYLATSMNYFNPKWTGERRLKNVVCVLEYVPKKEELSLIKHV